jgi:hypothetical protein
LLAIVLIYYRSWLVSTPVTVPLVVLARFTEPQGPVRERVGWLGCPWLITGALGLTIAGAAVTAMWARSHAVP